MENASKALIMAASILLGLMIISLGVALFNIFSKYSENAQKDLAERQIGSFNEEFLKHVSYTSTDMTPQELEDKRIILTAHDVVSIANLAKQNNINYGFYDADNNYTTEDKKSDSTNYIQIEVVDKNKRYANFEDASQEKYTEFLNANDIVITIDSTTGQQVATTKRYICNIEDVHISMETKKVKRMKIISID